MKETRKTKKNRQPSQGQPSERVGRDTHLYLDEKMWEELRGLAEKEDRSVTGEIRVLIKEALAARRTL